jgi:hypothetical protein
MALLSYTTADLHEHKCSNTRHSAQTSYAAPAARPRFQVVEAALTLAAGYSGNFCQVHAA